MTCRQKIIAKILLFNHFTFVGLIVHYWGMGNFSLYAAKLILCYGLCFVVSDFVVPALVGKQTTLLGGIGNNLLTPFCTLVIPFFLFWYILSPHTDYVWDRESGGNADIQRGVTALSSKDLETYSQTQDQVTPRQDVIQIRIVSTPPGDAPPAIREAWNGIIFSLESEYEKPQKIGLTQRVYYVAHVTQAS